MKLPYVIDNQTHVLAEILKGLLTEDKGRSLDVATAYFTVGGFGLVQDGLTALGNFKSGDTILIFMSHPVGPGLD